ncbi:MAG: sulfatase [Phycisphaerae bacterium]|nr:sulfatase [Phycisphaerae bacterium]
MAPHVEHHFNRRSMLKHCCGGFGSIALASMFATEAMANLRPTLVDPASISPLSPRLPHFAQRAKRVIFLFMHGGPSQVDTFDYKPMLQRDDGKPLPFPKPRVVFAETGNLLGSPFKFKQHGQSGAWVSNLFPNVAEIVDELCFIKSLHGSNPAHGAALLKIHTGSDNFVRPSMGSWITYGLGSENSDLPGFITICPTLGHGGVNNFSSAFLPAAYHGTSLGHAGIKASKARFEHMTSMGSSRSIQRAQLDLLKEIHEEQLDSAGPDLALEGRIETFELAFRMQMEAPDVMDLGNESPATLRMYGIDEPKTENFGRQCLMARRFSEKGVRFVQCTHSYKWDQHGDLRNGHTSNAAEVDKPIAGLIRDLKSRGMLDDTLVLWGGEFGRTPVSQGGRDGRDHNPHGFTMFMAGGGVKPGFSWGSTDEYGYYAQNDKVHVHDLHATIMHLLGIDHERLTYHHAGRDFRLTDVAGSPVTQIMI